MSICYVWAATGARQSVTCVENTMTSVERLIFTCYTGFVTVVCQLWSWLMFFMEQFKCDNMNDPAMSHDSCGQGGCQALGDHCCSCSANRSRAAQCLRYLKIWRHNIKEPWIQIYRPSCSSNWTILLKKHADRCVDSSILDLLCSADPNVLALA